MVTGANIESILDEIEFCLRERENIGLSGSEKGILRVLAQNPSTRYANIAEALSEYRPYSKGHIRNIGCRLWQRLSDLMGKKINKRNVVDQLRIWHKQQQLQTSNRLIGRDHDIQELLRQLRARYQIVCVTGMPRVGKSAVVGATVRLISSNSTMVDLDEFTICWFDASTFPTVSSLYQGTCQRLNKTVTEDDNADCVFKLMDLLRRNHLLLVIDNADSLYASQKKAGTFSYSTEYERFLCELAKDPILPSCLVWVSRVQPFCLDPRPATVQEYPVRSLDPDHAIVLLQQEGVEAKSADDYTTLVNFCDSNPGLLLTAARKLQKSFDGRASAFIKYPLQVSNNEDDHWRQAIREISEPERLLLVWLLIRPLKYEEITRLQIPGMGARDCIQGFESLQKRGFVKSDNAGIFQVRPTFLEHVLAEYLVDRIANALLAEKALSHIQHHPLIYPRGQEWRRQWQRIHLLEPLREKIQEQYWHQEAKVTWVQELLAQLRSQPDEHPSSLHTTSEVDYAAGILLTLATTLQLPLASLDFTGLTIRYADLQGAALSGFNASQCHFQETVFPLSLQTPVVAAMSAEGDMVAVGDANGQVFCWKKVADQFRLHQYTCLKPPPGELLGITAIAMYKGDVLVIAMRKRVYRWWTTEENTPKYLWEAEEPIQCLAHGADYIAAGLTNGGIDLFYLMNQNSYCLPTAHTHAISALTFDPRGISLGSIGFGDRVLQWDLLAEPQPSFYDEGPGIEARTFLTIRWTSDGLICAGIRNGHPWVKRGNKHFQDLPSSSMIRSLILNPNGSFLAGLNERGDLSLWDHHSALVCNIQLQNKILTPIALSNCGRHLMTRDQGNQPGQISRIQLWDTQSSRLTWVVSLVEGAWDSLKLEGTQGISAAESAYLLADLNKDPD